MLNGDIASRHDGEQAALLRSSSSMSSIGGASASGAAAVAAAGSSDRQTIVTMPSGDDGASSLCDRLDDELWCRIFRLLDESEDRKNAALVCKRFASLLRPKQAPGGRANSERGGFTDNDDDDDEDRVEMVGSVMVTVYSRRLKCLMGVNLALCALGALCCVAILSPVQFFVFALGGYALVRKDCHLLSIYIAIGMAYLGLAVVFYGIAAVADLWGYVCR